MGEVYRARDRELHREVAIKVLPAAMAENDKRLMRFAREARALAALSHPNIATVYGIEGAGTDGRAHGRALVMELVNGEDLSVRLRRGRVPLIEALSIARQVSEALAAAHDAGIVHRDLKPANIKLRDDGTVKVLDFGLAKGVSRESDIDDASEPGADSALPPTITISADVTEDGATVGTAAYMAPEQAKGKSVDKRVDIWAFGVVLYEMLAGRRPFVGADAREVIAHVLASTPDWSALPADTPSGVRRLLIRCLTKDRRQRLHDIGDARLEIEDVLGGASSREGDGSAWRGRYARWVVLAALAAVVMVGIAAWTWKPVAQPVTYVHVDVAPAEQLNAGGIHPTFVLPAGGARTALAWSPDGRALAFIGVQNGVRRIFVRELGAELARPLSGTDGARALAFSSNGADIAFWADGAIRTVKLAGGPVVRVCDAQDVNGIAFGATRIVFSQGNLWSADLSAGGNAQALALAYDLRRQASPVLLPGEQAVLYTEYLKQWTSGDERVMVMPLTPGAAPRLLIPRAADARYLSSGHLLFLRQGTLFIVPFDLSSLELRGDPVAVLKDVAQSSLAWDSSDLTLGGQFAVSPQGDLAYVPSNGAVSADRELVRVDRRGAVTPLLAPARGYRNHVALSPSGDQLAVSVQTATDIQLFALDIARGSLSRLGESLHGEVNLATWSSRDVLAVQVIDRGEALAAIVRPRLSVAATVLPESASFWASSLTADGRLVGMRGGDLWVYHVPPSSGPPTRLTSTTAAEEQPMWSPDGQWVAYTSSATGRSEVYVRAATGSGEGVMVSVDGGSAPAWNPDGRELFYLAPSGLTSRMMSVAVNGSLRFGRPVELFRFDPREVFLGTSILTPYAVDQHGQHFYGVRQVAGAFRPVTEVSIVLNWLADVRTRLR